MAAAKKIYQQDGLKFNTKAMLEYYKELKELKKNKAINSFTLPTLKEVKTKTKYGAKKCQINENTFDSIMESKFYIHLKENKNIKKIELQPSYLLLEGYIKNNKKVRPITYKADFKVTLKDNTTRVFDVKGTETDAFKLKKKLFEYKYPDTLECVRLVKNEWIDIYLKKEVQI